MIVRRRKDGYLNTRFSHRPEPRFSDFEWGHELYAGHMLGGDRPSPHHRPTTSTPPCGWRITCAVFGDGGLDTGHPRWRRSRRAGRTLDEPGTTCVPFLAARGRGLLGEIGSVNSTSG